MIKKKSDWREWLAFNLAILVFTVLWYGMEVTMWELPVDAGLFILMLLINFLAGLFGRIGLWMYHSVRDDEVSDV
jgi:uncharacterized ion transporter superfamily protein YfcC